MQQYCDQIFEIIKASKDEPIPFAAHIKEAYVALTKLNSDNIEQTEVSKTRATMLYLLDRIDASTFPAGFELMLPTRRFTKESENVSVKVDGVVAPGTYNAVLFNDLIFIYSIPAAKAEKNVLNKVIKTKKEGKLTKGIFSVILFRSPFK